MPRFDLSLALAARAIANANAEALDAGDQSTYAVRCNCPACLKGASGGNYSAEHATGGAAAAAALTQTAAVFDFAPVSDSAIREATTLGVDTWQTNAAHDSFFGF